MTITQYIEKQSTILKQLTEQNKPLEIAARTTMQIQAKRIFEDGKKTDGSDIGQYDTSRPLYVNPDASPRAGGNKAKGIEGLKPTLGKTGRATFVSGIRKGQPHKTTYVDNYKEFRNRIGRRIDKVDLTLSGDLQSDFRNTGKLTGAEPKKISANEYQITLSRKVNQDKMEGLQAKYGSITDLSKEERSEFIRVINFEFRKAFQ